MKPQSADSTPPVEVPPDPGILWTPYASGWQAVLDRNRCGDLDERARAWALYARKRERAAKHADATQRLRKEERARYARSIADCWAWLADYCADRPADAMVSEYVVAKRPEGGAAR